MLVDQVMQSKLLTVTPETRLSEARQLTRQRGIRHLLVVDKGDERRLVGIVSDRDMKGTSTERAIGDIMTRDVITLAPSTPVEEAGGLMIREKISALPVTSEGRLVGIVTETDVLDVFVRALGAGEPSSRLEIKLGADGGALADIVRIIESAGTRISSVMTLADAGGGREIVIRMPTINPLPAVHALAAKGYSVTAPWRG